MEKIQNAVSNIIESSRRFENPKDELLYYEFAYFEKIYKGVLKMPKEMAIECEKDSFIELICRYSDLREETISRYEEIRGDYYNDNHKKFDEFFDVVCGEIENNYKSGNEKWKENIKNIIDQNLEKLGHKQEKLNNDSEIDKEGKRFGLIHVDLVSDANLEEFGIKNGDECLSIHFKDLFNQKNKDQSINNIFSSNSLSKLAVGIIEEYPQVKAIIARSWLVDSPIGKRIGFNIFKKHKKIMNGMGFWGQFVNENGQVDKKRMQEFLKTGVPQYLPSEGFIKTEDFLKKYLPKDKRGVIKLKELTEESKENINDFENLKEKVNKDWRKLSREELLSIFNDSKVISNYIKTEKGKIWLSAMTKAKESNIKPEELNGFNMEDIRKDFRNYCEGIKKYVTKEIVI
ncbi:MAG TPA: hypothetical protein VMR49_01940 [Candidatus Paceibacterota bacterium]|jgi:hypothetical protein|nr:hypothetical protein [Candidatus Paceibacterota bacterium]